MSDVFVRDLLKQWHLDTLIDDFREADIDERAMAALAANESIVDTIIKSPGRRAIFLVELRKMMSQTKRDQSPDQSLERPISRASTRASPELQVPLAEAEPSRAGPSRERPTKKKTPMCYIPFPAPLPPLSESLQAAEKAGTLKSCFREVVRLHGNHILAITPGKLSAPDYQNYSLILTQRYPALRDESHGKPNGSLSQALSHFVRNTKYNAKKKNLTTTTTKKRRNNAHQVANVSEPSVSNSEEIHVSDLLKEMEKWKGNPSMLKLLLKNTYHERRAMIVNADSCAQILELFPVMKNLDLLLYDLSLTIPMEGVDGRMRNVVSKLKTIFPSTTEENEELEILNLFAALLKRLHPQGVKGNRALLTVSKAGKEVDLSSNGLQAPCASVFVADSGITDAFLLVEGKILLHEKNVSTKAVILGLIGVYFVFDRQYPACYYSFLRFLENEVLGLTEKPMGRGSLSFNRFMAEYTATSVQH